jgi:hypothetical protein
MNKKTADEISYKLHHAAAMYISGKSNNVLKESHNPKVKTYNELVESCKLLKEALESQDVDKISFYLNKKQRLSKRLYDLTCIRWRL